jgi:hypothetical protein
LEVPSKELFKRNLEFLQTRMTEESFFVLKNSPPSESSLLLVSAGENKQIDFLIEKDGKEIRLHSRRDPLGEAERQIESWMEQENPDWKETIVVFGFSGMHHILSLAKRLDPEGMLLIAENTKEAFLKAIEYCNLSELGKTGANIFFAVSDQHETISNEYRFKLRQRKRLKTKFFTHPGAHRAFPEKYDYLLKSLARETRLETINRGSRAAYSKIWQKNALENLPELLTNAPIDILKNKFEGCTGLVVGAGPSLNETIPYIKESQNNLLIITVGTALKPLLSAGIIPDMIVAVDWDPLTLKQYEGISIEKLFLAAESIIDHRLLDKFSGQLFFFASNTLTSHNEWLKSFGALPERLSVGGTVTFTATDLARHMGCRDIIFAGFDLCMRNDGTTHAEGSMYSGEKNKPGDLVEVQGNYGKKVLTTPQFRTYIDMMNSYLYCETFNNNACFYNATGGGALLNHAPAILPEELSGIASKKIEADKKKSIGKLFTATAGKCDLTKTLETGRKTVNELEKIKDLSNKAIEACRILGRGDNIKHSGMLRKELDKIDRQIKENKLANMLVSGALQPLIMEVFSEDAAETPQGTLENNLNFYSHFEKTSSELQKILGTSLSRIEENNKQK